MAGSGLGRIRRITLVSVLCMLAGLASAGAAFAAAPTISTISPNNGPDAGGTSVAITGTGFITGSTIKFGSSAATGVTIHSAESITATSPAGNGSELANVTVTNSNGTSVSVPKDQFAYDPTPVSPWLGLDKNSVTYLGPVNFFSNQSISYDRSFELVAGELPTELEGEGKTEEFETSLKDDGEYGMIPVSVIEYKGYGKHGISKSDPEFPQERTKKEEEEGKGSIKEYVAGFIRSALAVIKIANEDHPGMQVLFEPINEPWNYTTPQYNGAEYAKVIAQLLPEVKAAGIPLSDIYVGAIGWDCTASECGEYCNVEHPKAECVSNDWVPAMYAAQPTLETEIQGWYFHPYGPPSGTEAGDSRGIESVPLVQAKMTSGQNNMIVSEIGYCATDVNGGEECGGEEKSPEAAQHLTEMLDNALPYHEAGWLRALLVYSRNSGGWAMQTEPFVGKLTKQGEALDAFASIYGQTWSAQPTPSPTGAKSAGMTGVSCTSSEACTAVGRYVNSSSVEVPLAEVWASKKWATQEAATPTGAKSSSLSSVFCTSSEACIAAGHYVNSSSVEVPLAEAWASKKWTIQESKTPSGAKSSSLSSVSCTSSEACTAVGRYINSSSVEVTLAERWNGKEWAIQETKTPTGAKSSSLSGVSCVSSEICAAVGHYVNSSSVEVPLAERWNGKEWSTQETKTPSGAKSSSLLGVSCSSSEACTAVGHYVNSSSVEVTLAERWNGKEWATQTAVNPKEAKSSSLTGLSCTSSEACTAVGHSVNSSSVGGTLAELWNGKEWAILTTATPKEAKSSSLAGVSCRTGVTCYGVGNYANSSGTELSLAESYTLHPPYAKTEAATSVTSTGATLQGVVNPEGQETKYHFEYGLTTSYGTKTTEVAITSGTSNLEESKAIIGLSASTNYHFRVVAANSAGTTYGEDRTLTTTGPPVNTAPPVVSSTTPDQNVPETTTTGSWTNSPTSYTYQWERCNAEGKECVSISGATSSTYTPAEADVAHTLVAKVTAANSAGSNSAASAATSEVKPVGEITEYALPSESRPHGITPGPNRDLWFTLNHTSKIGEITPAGTITEYGPAGTNPNGITEGPDGNIWYTSLNPSAIHKLTALGTFTEFVLSKESNPDGITQGPDGNLWFADSGSSKVCKVTTSGIITEYALPAKSTPGEITQGPGEDLWFIENGSNRIGKITTSGTITEYALPSESSPGGIAMGPDGNIWYTDIATNKIGKITSSGTITEYALPKESWPEGITPGPDGNLWFIDAASSKIGRITTSGTITEYSLPKGSAPSGSMAEGPDGSIWFTDSGTSKVGKIVP